MAAFETTSLDIGVVNTVPAGAPATVVTTAINNSGTINGQKVKLAGAMEDIEYTVLSPGFQINGSTQATGSFTVTINFYAQDGTTLVGTYGPVTQQCSQTVNGQVVGTAFTHRVALPMAPSGTVTVNGFVIPEACDQAQAVIVVTGACGQLTAGWSLGGHRRNRAG